MLNKFSKKYEKNSKSFLRSSSKKGQGLSLNVIIIAALALIVLVVLVVIFTSQAAQTGEKVEDVSGDAALELQKIKLNYGDCHPTSGEDRDFKSDFNSANNAGLQDDAVSSLESLARRCRSFGTESSCGDADVACSWK
jgi:hypothetical protein